MIPNTAKMANNCSNLLEILYSKPFNAAGNNAITKTINTGLIYPFKY